MRPFLDFPLVNSFEPMTSVYLHIYIYVLNQSSDQNFNQQRQERPPLFFRQVHGCLFALPRRCGAKGCERSNNGDQDGQACRLCQLVPDWIQGGDQLPASNSCAGGRFCKSAQVRASHLPHLILLQPHLIPTTLFKGGLLPFQYNRHKRGVGKVTPHPS